jgi:benzylsuccinate CoA-transferase BbsF subunit
MQGAEGPHSRYIGFGSTIAALSGLVALSGVPGRAPVGTGTHFPDHVPNPGHALVAVLAAVRHLRRTGQGQEIELSQLESTINVLGPAFVEAGLGQAPQAVGNQTRDAAPHGAYRCRDGEWVVIACRDDVQWRSLVAALDIDAPARLGAGATRKQEEQLVDTLVGAAVVGHDRGELLHLLAQAAVPSAAVNSSRDIVENEVLWRRGFWRDIEHPVIGRIPINRSPFRLVDGPEAVVTRPPLLGEDTDDVLADELGLDRDELDRLTAEGVLY